MRIPTVLFGLLLMVDGVATQIEAGAHQPHYSQYLATGGFGHSGWTGWSSTAYDAARVGGWALLMFGAVIVAFALVRELRTVA